MFESTLFFLLRVLFVVSFFNLKYTIFKNDLTGLYRILMNGFFSTFRSKCDCIKFACRCSFLKFSSIEIHVVNTKLKFSGEDP